MSYSQAGDHTLMCPEDNTLNFQGSDYTLICPEALTIPLFTLYVPKLKWLCPETRRRYSKEAHEQNTDNDA